jgi:glucose uptake protein
MNLPIEGEPVEIPEFFKGTLKDHFLGLAGGAIWFTGLISNLVATSAPQQIQVGAVTSYAIGQGAILVGALWGLLLWKEFAGADSRIKLQLLIMIVLFVFGLGLVAMAPLFAK